MKCHHDPIRNQISQSLLKVIIERSPNTQLTLDKITQLVAPPPQVDMGHLAFPCFALSKELRKAPNKISEELAAAIPESSFIDEAKSVGPYVNFHLNLETTGRNILESILSEEMFQRPLTKNSEKTMIEYSQPNTHKELHVGHMRNLSLGHSLSQIMRYCDVELLTSTFPGDVGTHVAKCLWYLKYHHQGEFPKERKGAYLGRLYTLGHNLLEEQKGTKKEEENRQQLTEILAQITNESGEFFDLWKETRQLSVELMQDVYKWANVEFDYWYWESQVDADSVTFVKKCYEEGKLVKSEGAIGMDLTEDKLGFALLLKSDGNGLYASKDVELARRKFEDHKIERNIYIVDSRQALHFSQVFKVLEKLGLPAGNCFHLKYEFVELPDGAMSSRKGNIIPIQDLIDNMVDHILKNYLERWDWPEEEKIKTANQVALGAIKFGMICMDNNKKIVFNMTEWLKLDGESGPYLQYVYARIQSLLKKLPETSENYDTKFLSHRLEHQLILKLNEFNTVALKALDQYRPATICTYLFELCKLFNGFYVECPIAKTDDKTRAARKALAKATGITLKQGLALLGIEAPVRM